MERLGEESESDGGLERPLDENGSGLAQGHVHYQCIPVTVKDKKKWGSCGKLLVVAAVVGAVLIIIGGLMFPLVDAYIKEQVKQKVVISNTSETYEVWQDVPIPVYMQFWLFNVGNPEEVKEGKTPYVEQLGPFTYRERRVKYNIVWNDNGTVTYKQNRTFEFVEDMSVSGEDTMITTINPLIATIAQNIQWWNSGLRQIVSWALSVVREDIIMTRPVHEVLWGYEDPALSILNSVDKKGFPTTKIGYFIRRNYTDDGLYTVYTGEEDYRLLGFIDQYNGAENVSIWTTEWANMVNGTDGTLGPPFRFDAAESPVFVSDLCRSIRGIYMGEVETPQGITLRRFGGDRRDMENATLNPDNLGFCTPQTNCLPTGLLNSTLCQEPVDGFPLPVVFSFPHFLYADPDVLHSVVGLNPVEKEHWTVIDQEPWTGLVLQVAKRLQINMYVQKVKNLGQTHNIQNLFFPIVWLNESSVVDDKWANKLKNELFIPKDIASYGRIAMIGLGGLTMVIACTLLAVQRRVKHKKSLSKLLVKPIPTAYDNPVGRQEQDDDVRDWRVPNKPLEDDMLSANSLVDSDWFDPASYDGDRSTPPAGQLYSVAEEEEEETAEETKPQTVSVTGSDS